MEEVANFAKEPGFRREMIEAQVAGNGVVSDNGGCQVRRVHIVYFLSQNGHIEHPHLIRIHHLSRNGVHLKDVKRWLSKLRGKEMPQNFAWSYKRRYKGGYVWQDILDEDLITPICDNEYVLKGSEISTTKSNNVKEDFEPKRSSPFEVVTNDRKYPSTIKEYSLDFSANTSTEIEESSFGSNVTTEDTTKNQDDKEVVQILQDKNEDERFLNKNRNDNNNEYNNKNKKCGDHKSVITSCFKVPLSPNYPFRKSSRASHMFRNWITCGTSNTNENAVMVINKRNGSRVSTVSSVSENNCKENNMGRQLCKEQKFREYEKSFNGKNEFNKNKSKKDSDNVKTFPAAYKPVNGPNCSQCGRQFNPEKLHSHMKYCRGMKAMAKSASSRAKTKTSRPYSPSATPSLHTFLLEK